MTTTRQRDTATPDTGQPPSAGTETPRPLIREWHTMTPDEQKAEWTALVEWVIWIHDLYELSREERLPLCWPRHPGLVEELRSLKAWRNAIYNSPDAAAAAHTARSWHGELRQTIAATATFWAPTCRAGHKDATTLSEAHPDLAEQWHEVGAPVMASAPTPQPVTAVGDEISDEDMSTAVAAGHAQPHSRSMPYYARLNGTWWTRSTDGTTWLRCTDPTHHAHLDNTSARMRAADTARDQLDHQ